MATDKISEYSKNRREAMNLRPSGYGNRFFVTEIINRGKVRKCVTCNEDINSSGIVVDGTPYHDECFNARN